MTATEQAKNFLNNHPDFEQLTDNIFSDGKNEFHVSILVEYVEHLEALGIKYTCNYDN